MKRIIYSILLGILLLAILALPVLASYYANLVVVESNGNAYTQVALLEAVDIDYLADNGYISSTGLDTRVTSGGTAIPHMLVDDSLMFVTDVEAYGSLNLLFETGETALTDFYVITGDGGYVTITDHANLELGNNFEVDYDGYMDTSGSNDFVEKQNAFRIFASSGDVIGGIYGSQASIVNTQQDTMSGLHSGFDTRVGQRVNSFAVSYITQSSFYLRKFGSPTGTAHARVRAVSDDSILGTVGSIDVSTLTTSLAWYDFTTSDVYNPSVQDLRITIEYDGGNGANFIYYGFENSDVCTGIETTYAGSWTDDSGDDMTFKAYWYPLDAYVSATMASGEAEVSVYADGSDLKMDIDGATEDTMALGGASVPDNANDIVVSNLPYYDSYTHTVSGTLRIDYDPNSIIAGTTLPNEDNPGTYDGTITWGSNPAGVAVTLGGLVSDEQLIPAGGAAEFPTPQDIAGETGQPGWTVALPTLTTHPLYPLVSTVNQVTDIPVGVLWIMGATFILAILFVWLIGSEQMMHQIFISLAGGGWVAFCWHQGIYPFWVIFIYATLAIAIVIGERSPTVS